MKECVSVLALLTRANGKYAVPNLLNNISSNYFLNQKEPSQKHMTWKRSL